jgi:heptosyltransferase-1
VRIAWVVHPLTEPLVQGHPSVDRVHVWQREGLGEFRRLVRELRGERYELAIDLQRLQKSALLARLSGAPRVLGFDRARTKEASWVWTNEHLAGTQPGRHRVEQYLEVARHLGCAAPVARRVLPREPQAEAWAEELVRELGAAPVLLNLGASKPANRWPPERFGEVARALERDVPVCLVGGPADRVRVVAGVAVSPGVRDLVGTTSLAQLVALARRARLFIGCDTGPMHIAAAVDTPVLALFGPADPAVTGPYGSEHRVLRVPSASAQPPRTEDITVEMVLEAARALLAQPVGR